MNFVTLEPGESFGDLVGRNSEAKRAGTFKRIDTDDLSGEVYQWSSTVAIGHLGIRLYKQELLPALLDRR